MNRKSIEKLLTVIFFITAALNCSSVNANDDCSPICHCWTGSIKSGLTLDWGNTECTDFCGGFCFNRQTSVEECLLQEYFFSGEVKYKKKSGSITDNKAWTRAAYRSYLNDRWSLQIKQRFEYDEIKSLHFGSHTLLSVGYWMLKCDDSCLITTAGVGYTYRKFSEKTESSPTVTFGADYKKTIRCNLKFCNLFEIIVPFDTPSNYSWLDHMKLHYDFSKRWGVEGCYKWEYLNSPSAGKERLDQTLDCSLVFKLC